LSISTAPRRTAAQTPVKFCFTFPYRRLYRGQKESQEESQKSKEISSLFSALQKQKESVSSAFFISPRPARIFMLK
jgi:hypothetical protein